MLPEKNNAMPPVNTNPHDLNKVIAAFITLFLSLLIIYSNSFRGEWHFDDFVNIVENPNIRISSFEFSEIKKCLYGVEQERLLRPLSYLSFALNYKFGGMDVFGFHVVNFIIHYLASIFLFLFIYKALQLPRLNDRYKNTAYPAALLATLFWALNPVWVTSVTYIVQRMASLAGLFYIMSMYFYLKGRTAENPVSSILFLGLCMICGLAAVFSKENAMMIPVSILLFDLLLIQGATKENIRKSGIIFVLIVLLTSVSGFIYTGGFSNAFGGYEIRDFSMAQRILTEPRVVLFYLSLLFYPVHSRLTFLYDIEVSRSLLQPWTTIPSIVLILSIIGLACLIARKHPLISYCTIFYFLNHVIEGSIFNLELIYEHRNYIPAMLLFVPPALFIIYIFNYFSYRKFIRFLIILGVSAILIVEGDNTYNRNKTVSSDYLLWLDNINKSPRLSRPHSNLGIIYFLHNENEKALREYEKALSLNNFGKRKILGFQYFNLGVLYLEQKQDDLALNYFIKSAAINPDDIQNYIYMAKIHLRHNKIKEARQVVEGKLKKYPHHSELSELYRIIQLKEGN